MHPAFIVSLIALVVGAMPQGDLDSDLTDIMDPSDDGVSDLVGGGAGLGGLDDGDDDADDLGSEDGSGLGSVLGGLGL